MISSIAGQGCGFDIDLVKMVSDAVTIPVIASSGAGAVKHFSEVFEKTNASAALAAGIFHRREVLIISFVWFFRIVMLCNSMLETESIGDEFGAAGAAAFLNILTTIYRLVQTNSSQDMAATKKETLSPNSTRTVKESD
jgi:hypothetical protein